MTEQELEWLEKCKNDLNFFGKNTPTSIGGEMNYCA